MHLFFPVALTACKKLKGQAVEMRGKETLSPYLKRQKKYQKLHAIARGGKITKKEKKTRAGNLLLGTHCGHTLLLTYARLP